MSNLLDKTGLSEEEAKVALIAWYEERTGQKWPTRQAPSPWVGVGGLGPVTREPWNPLWSLDSMALITAAMTGEEKEKFGDELWTLCVPSTIGAVGEVAALLSLSDAPTRATAAVLALGLEKRE